VAGWGVVKFQTRGSGTLNKYTILPAEHPRAMSSKTSQGHDKPKEKGGGRVYTEGGSPKNKGETFLKERKGKGGVGSRGVDLGGGSVGKKNFVGVFSYMPAGPFRRRF